MSPATLEAELGQLHSDLEGLLSCLEAQPLAGEQVLGSVWGEVHRSFERVRAGLDGLALDGDAHAAVQERVEHCLRLHAVATGLLVRRRDELVIEQRLCNEARQRLRTLESEGTCGDSCDLSG